MQHKSTGPFFFQVFVCICYGVAAHGALVKVMSALSIESPAFQNSTCTMSFQKGVNGISVLFSVLQNCYMGS